MSWVLCCFSPPRPRTRHLRPQAMEKVLWLAVVKPCIQFLLPRLWVGRTSKRAVVIAGTSSYACSGTSLEANVAKRDPGPTT
jgi:hypothetical protein